MALLIDFPLISHYRKNPGTPRIFTVIPVTLTDSAILFISPSSFQNLIRLCFYRLRNRHHTPL